jgi:DNA-binding CsgD family transcriptional regulator
MGTAGTRARAVREDDVRKMLGYVTELSSLEHPEEFRTGVLPGLRDLVPSHIASYNEVDFSREWMFAADDPPGSMTSDAPEVFVKYGEQNPLVSRFQRTRDGRAYKWSDLMTRRELHATELYELAYRPMRVEYQMAICLPSPEELVIGIAFNRERRDFGERDRTLLNLVRAPLVQAYRTVERYAALTQRLEAMEQGMGRAGTGVVLLEMRRGEPCAAFASEEAARALGGIEAGQLPEDVRGWLAAIGPSRPGMAPSPPLVVEDSAGARSTVQFLPARRRGDADALLVEPVGERISVPTLRAAGLTPRESEVLRLVALGRSNAEVADELVVSRRTVHKHLENVYAKLGVSSRTQAVVTAWSIARGEWPPGD